VQDILEDTTGAVTEDMKAALGSGLGSHVMAGMKCPNANHVLQCALTQLRQRDSQFIVDELLVDVRRPAKNKYGIRVLQRCLEFGGPEKSNELAEALLAHTFELCTNEWGIYIMGHLMEHGTQDHRTRLTRILLSTLFELVQNKYAPYVMQKVLTDGGVQNRHDMLEAFIGNSSLLVNLAGDRFGYETAVYVLQMASHQDKVALLGQLSGMSEQLCKSRYGKKLNTLVKEQLVELAIHPMN